MSEAVILAANEADTREQLEAELAAERATVAQPQERTCRIVAHVTDGLMTGFPKRLFEFSCGHSVTLAGLTDEPAFCAICGAVVVKPAGEHDTREEIEADIDCYREEESPDCLCVPIYRVRSWLNRQAAITEREIAERREAYGQLACGGTDCMKLVDELTADKTKLQAEIEKLEHDCELLFDEKRKLTADVKRWADAANEQRLVAMEQADKVQELTAERELYRDNMLFQAGRVADVTTERNELREKLAEKQHVCDVQRESFRKMEAELAAARHAALGLWRRMDALRLAGRAPSQDDLDGMAAKLSQHGIEAS